MSITRSTRTVSQKFFESKDEFNYGSICFTVTEVTDEHADGTVKVYNRYTKNDGRRFTDQGRAYFSYDNEAKMKAAIKRVARTAAENSLEEKELLTWG